MIIPTMNVFAAGCGNWEIYSFASPKCFSNKCYNIPFNPYESWGQYVYLKRQCVRDDNTSYWEYDSRIEWSGCCEL